MFEPWDLRPKRDWAVIRQDQRKKVSAGGLYVPTETNYEKLHEGSGCIIRLGDGPKSRGADLSVGLRVAYRTYLRHANKLETTAKWEDGEPQEFFLIDVNDITAVLEPGVEVGLLSGK